MSINPSALYENVTSTITLKASLPNIASCSLDQTKLPAKRVAENIFECEVLLRHSSAELFISFDYIGELVPTSFVLSSILPPEISQCFPTPQF
jgi:hypothetical protein